MTRWDNEEEGSDGERGRKRYGGGEGSGRRGEAKQGEVGRGLRQGEWGGALGGE